MKISIDAAYSLKTHSRNRISLSHTRAHTLFLSSRSIQRKMEARDADNPEPVVYDVRSKKGKVRRWWVKSVHARNEKLDQRKNSNSLILDLLSNKKNFATARALPPRRRPSEGNHRRPRGLRALESHRRPGAPLHSGTARRRLRVGRRRRRRRRGRRPVLHPDGLPLLDGDPHRSVPPRQARAGPPAEVQGRRHHRKGGALPGGRRQPTAGRQRARRGGAGEPEPEVPRREVPGRSELG